MKRILPATLVTLTLWGCGNSDSTRVTSTRELAAGPERTAAVERAVSRVLLEGEKLGVTAPEALSARTVLVDDDGTEHVRLERTWQGLRVIGGDLVVHQRGGADARGFGLAGQPSLASVASRPTLDASGAALRARSAFVGSLSGPRTAKLVVDARQGHEPALAYEVVLDGYQPDQTPSELHVLVDATTGALRGKWDAVHTTAAVGKGASLYSGQVSIQTNSTLLGGYALRDTTRGGGFYTTDMNNLGSVPLVGNTLPLPPLLTPGTLFTDSDNVWGDGTPGNRQSAAVDAHFGQQTTYDYYRAVHGRDGIDGAGRMGYSRVHYGDKYNNAFWYDLCFCMTYGDGDGSILAPLTSLDVAGHEMTHGITSQTAGLTYEGESGGLNEATSDIFGSLVEYYASIAQDPGDYLIGETIFTPSTPGDALRYMHQPSLDGKSPDCWSPSLASLDVHYSSGVANHFFYLLAEGSNPTAGPASPTCDGSSHAGIGRLKAGKIWYRALTVYMTSSTNYAGARAATLSAASDLYGAGSPEVSAVAAAWSAVSVN